MSSGFHSLIAKHLMKYSLGVLFLWQEDPESGAEKNENKDHLKRNEEKIVSIVVDPFGSRFYFFILSKYFIYLIFLTLTWQRLQTLVVEF